MVDESGCVDVETARNLQRAGYPQKNCDYYWLYIPISPGWTLASSEEIKLKPIYHTGYLAAPIEADAIIWKLKQSPKSPYNNVCPEICAL